jgi:hypothetical protein
MWKATACSAKWILGMNTELAHGQWKTKENLHRYEQSQDLLEAQRLLANSPAFKYEKLGGGPQICSCFMFKNVHSFF